MSDNQQDTAVPNFLGKESDNAKDLVDAVYQEDLETSFSDDCSNERIQQDRARTMVARLIPLLAHHKAPQPVIESFRSQVLDYLSHPSEQVFFKRAKYLTVAPIAKYLKQDLPEPPDQIPRFTGQWKLWSRCRLKCFSDRNTHLWYSFLQGKRAALPLSIELVYSTYEKHRKAMEVRDPITPEILSRTMKGLMPVLDEVESRLRHVVDTTDGEGKRGFASVRDIEHACSTRACFEAPRSQRGQAGHLVSRTPGIPVEELGCSIPSVALCHPKNPAYYRQIPELKRMVFYPRVVREGRVLTNVVLEEYEYSDAMNVWKKTIDSEIDVLYKELGKKDRPLNCTIQAVLEPLKVRVISKGEALPYYYVKDIQKDLHTAMRGMDCFRLIGRPLSPTDLWDLKDNPVCVGSGRLEWFSIDYSAATDNLSASLSREIMLYLTRNLDERSRLIALKVLAPHKCHYPDIGKLLGRKDEFPKLDPVVQKNGQLMGSILSFPILCLANLGLYLDLIREDPRPLREKLAGVLVNGDDMLYVAPASLWSEHIAAGKAVGLEMSIGKAYHHPVLASVNSTCYHYDLSKPSGGPGGVTPRVIHYLNMGLAFGQRKVMGGDDVTPDDTVCSVINRFVQGALPGRGSEVLSWYIHRHRREIDNELRGRNLFLPISQGGAGVEAPPGFKYHITHAQQILAGMLQDESSFYPSQRPLLGPEPLEVSQEVRAPWLSISDPGIPAMLCGQLSPMELCVNRINVDNPLFPLMFPVWCRGQMLPSENVILERASRSPLDEKMRHVSRLLKRVRGTKFRVPGSKSLLHPLQGFWLHTSEFRAGVRKDQTSGVFKRSQVILEDLGVFECPIGLRSDFDSSQLQQCKRPAVERPPKCPLPPPAPSPSERFRRDYLSEQIVNHGLLPNPWGGITGHGLESLFEL